MFVHRRGAAKKNRRVLPLLQVGDEICWIHDPHVFDGTDGPKISITRDDSIGTAVIGGLEEHVVVWITAAADFAGRFDEITAESKQAEEILNVAFVDSVSVLQPRARQDRRELFENRQAHDRHE